VIRGLHPWPLADEGYAAAVDDEFALDDVEVAARTDWMFGDRGGLTAARHRLTLQAHCGLPRIHRVITIGFDRAAPSAVGRPLPWSEWADQYEAWWRGWKERWAAGREDERGSAEVESGHAAGDEAPVDPAPSIDEPVVDLDPHDAPAELVRPVLAWFEAQHSEADHDLVYARSIPAWWIEGRRGMVSVLGVVHWPPSEGDPAESLVVVWHFALRRRDQGWLLRTWSSADVEEPLPSWASRWTSGPLQVR
jgi:hypothetical protein